jgi:hypothetical protein
MSLTSARSMRDVSIIDADATRFEARWMLVDILRKRRAPDSLLPPAIPHGSRLRKYLDEALSTGRYLHHWRVGAFVAQMLDPQEPADSKSRRAVSEWYGLASVEDGVRVARSIASLIAAGGVDASDIASDVPAGFEDIIPHGVALCYWVILKVMKRIQGYQCDVGPAANVDDLTGAMGTLAIEDSTRVSSLALPPGFVQKKRLVRPDPYILPKDIVTFHLTYGPTGFNQRCISIDLMKWITTDQDGEAGGFFPNIVTGAFVSLRQSPFTKAVRKRLDKMRLETAPGGGLDVFIDRLIARYESVAPAAGMWPAYVQTLYEEILERRWNGESRRIHFPAPVIEPDASPRRLRSMTDPKFAITFAAMLRRAMVTLEGDDQEMPSVDYKLFPHQDNTPVPWSDETYDVQIRAGYTNNWLGGRTVVSVSYMLKAFPNVVFYMVKPGAGLEGIPRNADAEYAPSPLYRLVKRSANTSALLVDVDAPYALLWEIAHHNTRWEAQWANETRPPLTYAVAAIVRLSLFEYILPHLNGVSPYLETDLFKSR